MLFAALVQSIGGFGFALFAVPLAAIAIELQTAVIVVSLGSLLNVPTGLGARDEIWVALVGVPVGVAGLLAG
jgi:hypothetical protein